MYLGEDIEDEFDGFEELCEASLVAAKGETSTLHPVAPITPEKYHSLFKPWRGGLLLKLLGKNVSRKVMQQRMTDLWQLK